MPRIPPRRGFTLLELLVLIAILALVIAILLPALKSVRTTAQQTARLMSVRQQYTALQLYTADHKLSYPFFGVPGDPSQGVTYGEAHIRSGTGFFVSQSEYWVSAIIPYLSGWRGLPDGAQIEPAGPSPVYGGGPGEEVGWFFGAVKITHTIFADPHYWRDEGPFASSLCGPTRSTEVAFPSRKGLLIAFAPASEDRAAPTEPLVGLADGSVVRRPFVTGRNIAPGQNPPLNMWLHLPCMATRDGVKGIDY